MVVYNIISNPKIQLSAPSQTVYTILAVLLALTVLAGISLMSKVKRAVTGNLIGSVAMFLAICPDALVLPVFLLLSNSGLHVDRHTDRFVDCTKCQMIQMPQLVVCSMGLRCASMIAGILTIINAKILTPFP